MKKLIASLAATAVVAAASYASIASAVVSTCTPDFNVPTQPEPNGTFCPKDGYNSQSVALVTADQKHWGYKIKLTKTIPGSTVVGGFNLMNATGGFAKGANGIQCPGVADNTPPPNNAFGAAGICDTVGSGATQPAKGRVVYNHTP
jgi:hypothetical protein